MAILGSGQAAIGCLERQDTQAVACVLPRTRLLHVGGGDGHPEGVVESSDGPQPGIAGHCRAAESEPRTAIEMGPQRPPKLAAADEERSSIRREEIGTIRDGGIRAQLSYRARCAIVEIRGRRTFDARLDLRDDPHSKEFQKP